MHVPVNVDIHVEVNGGISVRTGHGIAHQVKDALLASELSILDVIVHIEPAPPPKLSGQVQPTE